MKRITDKTFRYVPSHETNIRKTFDRIRKEQRDAKRRVVVLPRPTDKAKG